MSKKDAIERISGSSSTLVVLVSAFMCWTSFPASAEDSGLVYAITPNNPYYSYETGEGGIDYVTPNHPYYDEIDRDYHSTTYYSGTITAVSGEDGSLGGYYRDWGDGTEGGESGSGTITGDIGTVESGEEGSLGGYERDWGDGTEGGESGSGTITGDIGTVESGEEGSLGGYERDWGDGTEVGGSDSGTITGDIGTVESGEEGSLGGYYRDWGDNATGSGTESGGGSIDNYVYYPGVSPNHGPAKPISLGYRPASYGSQADNGANVFDLHRAEIEKSDQISGNLARTIAPR